MKLHERSIEEVVKKLKIKVYCSCRMPQDHAMTGSIILVRTYLVLYSVGKRKLLLLLVHPHDILILQLYSCYHTCLRAVVTITVYT